MKKIFALLIVLFLVPLTTSAQNYCEGNFDYDDNVDGSDASIFKTHFGRSSYENPCPPDGPALVPKTGQAASYYGTGDDAYYQAGVEWPNPRFTNNLNGTVTDNLTGLIWLKNANCFGVRTWFQALSDCNGLKDRECNLTDSSNPGDWRLPNRGELLSLIDLYRANPALSLGHPFENVQGFHYWSSSVYAGSLGAWTVVMLDGFVGIMDRIEATAYVLPVRGGRNQNRFKDNFNGTVTDNDTGLIWLKNADCFGWMNWYDAMSATAILDSGQCDLTDYSVAGYWRIPTQSEWEEFVCTQFTDPVVCDVTGAAKWIEGNPFNNVQSSVYWSETSLDPDNAWAILMSNGNGSFGHKSGSDCLVWPVRRYRFTDNGDGTITDTDSDLIWLKNMGCFGTANWDDAISTVSTLASGQCGLTDDSNPGDWRLPTNEELGDFACPQHNEPGICNTTGMGKWKELDPFYNMPFGNVYFWSSTTYESDSAQAYSLNSYLGFMSNRLKSDNSLYIWPVRDP